MAEILTVMVEPKRAALSDLNSAYEEPAKKWTTRLGWGLALGLCMVPLAIVFQDSIRSARADAEFERRMAQEEREMKAILASMAKGNAESKRIAREIESIKRRGR